MNISRRTVIKGLGATVAATTAAASSSFASSTLQNDNKNTDTLRVQIAHQWGKESMAAMLKNTSAHPVTITDITSVAADHGRFNFSDLTSKGPLTLAPGEVRHVPFTVMGTPIKPYGHFDNRLQKKIKQTLHISTANQSAQVSTTLNPLIV